MLARDLMRREVFTIQAEQSVSELIDLLVQEHIHGCPVVDRNGDLVGVVTQQDVFFSAVTREGRGGAAGQPPDADRDPSALRVRDLMTAPALSVTEETGLASLCRMMHRLRIHRVPVVKKGKVTGIISSLDILAELGNHVDWT